MYVQPVRERERKREGERIRAEIMSDCKRVSKRIGHNPKGISMEMRYVTQRSPRFWEETADRPSKATEVKNEHTPIRVDGLGRMGS